MTENLPTNHDAERPEPVDTGQPRRRLQHPPVPPVVCATWCEHGHGHPDQVSRDDQWCNSDMHPVPLTRPPVFHESDEGDPYLAVYLQRDVGEPATVLVGYCDRAGVRLTPDDAEQLADELVEHAALERGRQPATCTRPDQRDVDTVRELLNLMENISDNDQRARYLLSSNWLRDRGPAAGTRLRSAGSPAPVAPLRTAADDLATALALWDQRDSDVAQPAVTAAGHDAVTAVDGMLAELGRLRSTLVSEIREHQDVSAARTDALLERLRRETGAVVELPDADDFEEPDQGGEPGE